MKVLFIGDVVGKNARNFSYKKIEYPSVYPSDEPRRRCPDISLAKKDLNYKPKIKIEDGLKQFIEWSTANFINENI